MKQKRFKEPKYLIQIDAEYSKVELIVIHLYTFETICNKIFITYWTEVYSHKSKRKVLFEMFESFNEFDKIFDTNDLAQIYYDEFKTQFEPYYNNLRCKNVYTNLTQKRDNIQSGTSDIRYFNKSSENWRHS